MTRDEMLAVLREGGAVCYGGTVINHPGNLPTEAELAVKTGDPVAVAEADNNLKQQLAALQAQLALLESAKEKEPAKVSRKGADSTETK